MSTRRTAFFLLAGALAFPLADAAQNTSSRTSRRTKTKMTPPRDYGEQPAERDRRLARECRNLANAGACAGFGYGS
jgi:hypothetical protein